MFRIRKSTHTRLKELRGGVLSWVLRQILSRDVIAPVLDERHYAALDARLLTVLAEVDKCILRKGEGNVLVNDDGFYVGKSPLRT